MDYLIYNELEEEQQTNKSILISVIKKEIKNNSNFLLVVDGKPGVGKSWAALKIASALDPNFTTDNVFFTLEDFLKNVNEKHPKGTVFIFDEAGVQYDNQLWHQKQAIMANHVMQTFRWKNFVVIFTVPDMGFTNKKATILYHGLLKLFKRNSQIGYVQGTFYNLTTLFGRMLTTHTRVKDQEFGGFRPAGTVLLFKPPKELAKAYEKKMATYKDSITQHAVEEIKRIAEAPGKKKRMLGKAARMRQLIDTVKDNPKEYTNKKGKLDWTLVSYKEQISPVDAKDIIKTIENL